jgi:hypothetical protein
MEVPASHHGRVRPEAKNSETEELARRVNASPITTESAKYSATIAQSAIVRVTGD